MITPEHVDLIERAAKALHKDAYYRLDPVGNEKKRSADWGDPRICGLYRRMAYVALVAVDVVPAP